MNIIEAIHSRRSIGQVKPDPVSKELISQLLEAAICAPNHHRTEPWKFFVLSGEGRRPLGRTLADIAAEKMTDPTTEENQIALKRWEERPYRAPVVIAVAVAHSAHSKAVAIEEVGAVNAAIQNMLLAAHALGLGAIWRTGLPAYHPKMRELFNLKEQDSVLGFVYVGYPDMVPPKAKRTPYTEHTVWMDS